VTPRSTLDLRFVALLGVVGLALAAFLAERTVLDAQIAGRPAKDDVVYWEQHVERNPAYPASRVRLAQAYQAAGRFDEAQREYEAALALDPDSDAAAIGRDGILRRNGEVDLALAQLEPYARDHPRCAICWYYLASTYLDRGRLDQAEAAAQALLASNLVVTSGMYSVSDFHFEAYLMAGGVAVARGEHDRAISLLRDAIARRPDNPRPHILEANSLLATAQPAAALAALERAESRLAPGDDALRGEIERLRRSAR